MQKRPDRAAGNNSHKTIDEFLHIFVRFPLIPFSNKITAQKPKSNFTFSILFGYFIRQASNYFQIRQFSMEFNFLYIFSHWLLRFFTHVSFFFAFSFVIFKLSFTRSLAQPIRVRSRIQTDDEVALAAEVVDFFYFSSNNFFRTSHFCCCCLCWTHMFVYNSNDIEREKESK